MSCGKKSSSTVNNQDTSENSSSNTDSGPDRPTFGSEDDDGDIREDGDDDSTSPPPAAFDTNWRAVLADTGAGYDCVSFNTSNCNADCKGNTNPDAYINAVPTNNFVSCDERDVSNLSSNKWTLLFQRAGAAVAGINLPDSTGSMVVYQNAGLEIDVDVDTAGTYYLSIFGVFGTNVNMTFTVDGLAKQATHPGSGGSNIGCYMPETYSFATPQSRIKFKVANDGVSFHLKAYRISSTKPTGLASCMGN